MKTNTAQTQAKARPWKIAPYISARGIHVTMAQIVDAAGNTIAVFESRDDAEQTLQAVNERDALLAVAACAENYAEYVRTGKVESRWTSKDGIAEAGSISNCEALNSALAALAAIRS